MPALDPVATHAVRVRRHAGVRGRLLREDPLAVEPLGAYRAAGGYAERDPEVLLALVEHARLRGRGGSGFPTATKLRTLRRHPPHVRRHVVANGEEGEPASWKDRHLLRTRPHLVLDGLWHCAQVVGAQQAHVYVSDDAAADAVRGALAELGGPPPLPTELHVVERSYVAGEETAVVRAIDGGPAKPTAKPPRPFESGIGGDPTLVQNVETLAHVALIAAHGVEPHRAHGTEQSTGTALFTLSRPGVGATLVEAPLGVGLGELLAAEGWADDVAHVLMGGFFGGLLPLTADDLPLSYEALSELGSGLGCGAIVALGADACPVSAAAEVMSYLAVANAGQCGACVKGTAAMRDALARLAGGTAAPDDLERLDRWADMLRGRGACATLDAAAQLARTLLDRFAGPVAEHVGRPCGSCATWRFTAPRTRFAIETHTEGVTADAAAR